MSKLAGVVDGTWSWQVFGHLLRMAVVACALGSVAACTWPPPSVQPVSPPPGVLNSPLMDNRWRVEEVTLHGEAVTFDLFKPVYVHFDRGGTVGIRSEGCGTASGYLIVYLGEQRYRIEPHISTPLDCGGGFLSQVDCEALIGRGDDPLACAQAIDAQFGGVNRALDATNEYELHDEQLILRGEDAEMRLVLDNPSD